MRYMKFSVILAGLLLSLASCEHTQAVDDKPEQIDSVKVDSVDSRSSYEMPEKKKIVSRIWRG